MMKLVSIVGALIVSFASVSNASLFISWYAGNGFVYDANHNAGILPSGGVALAQLIWRPNNSGSLALSGEGTGVDAANAFTANYVTGDDVWLADFEVNAADRTWGDYAWFDDAPSLNNNSAAFTDGYIYARIFATVTPGVGDTYYVGRVQANLNRDGDAVPADTAQVYDLNRNIGNSVDSADIFDGDYSFQVVPEPGTIGLLALGIATLGGAAHKRRKTTVDA